MLLGHTGYGHASGVKWPKYIKINKFNIIYYKISLNNELSWKGKVTYEFGTRS